MKKLIWISWLALTIAVAGFFLFKVFYAEDKTTLLIGETTYGHYQIEMQCSACHSESFSDKDVIQETCVGCHGEELEQAHDSHPKKKFTDPREAFRLEILDGRYCISCHTEHQKDKTHAMGVTLPDDYCFHCHQDIGEERESHKDLPFDSCASAGCHNYHDNRALYEDFLVSNAGKPWLLEIAKVTTPNAAKTLATQKVSKNTQPFENKMADHPEATHQWQASSHAEAGVNCGGCHATAENPNQWIEQPNIAQCQSCHSQEAEGFTKGKHGMRLANNGSSINGAMTPADARLTFKPASLNDQQGCNSCHSSHSFNTTTAATESCLSCHNDEHSLAFEASPHGKLWAQHLTGQLTEDSSVVSCATCHMPRTEKKAASQAVVFVEHNQNHNLRPNEKMIRSVCMNCHSLEFSIDALADPALIKNNFNGKAGTHIESVDWALKR